jgi:hypothetical protein
MHRFSHASHYIYVHLYHCQSPQSESHLRRVSSLLTTHRPIALTKFVEMTTIASPRTTDRSASIFDNATPDSFKVDWSAAALRIDFVPDDGSSSVATWPPTKIDDDDTKSESLWVMMLGYNIEPDGEEQLDDIISEFEEPKVQLQVIEKARRKRGLPAKFTRRLDVAHEALLSKDMVTPNPRITRH